MFDDIYDVHNIFPYRNNNTKRFFFVVIFFEKNVQSRQTSIRFLFATIFRLIVQSQQYGYIHIPLHFMMIDLVMPVF